MFLEICKKFNLSSKQLTLKSKIHDNYFQYSLFGMARIAFEKNEIGESIGWFRRCLLIPFQPSEVFSLLRMKAMKHLANLLLLHVCDDDYLPPNLSLIFPRQNEENNLNLKLNVQLFSPKKRVEEIILLLQNHITTQQKDKENSSSSPSNSSLHPFLVSFVVSSFSLHPSTKKKTELFPSTINTNTMREEDLLSVATNTNNNNEDLDQNKSKEQEKIDDHVYDEITYIFYPIHQISFFYYIIFSKSTSPYYHSKL